MRRAYNCKFCGMPGEVEYEPVPEYRLNFEKWLTILCCTRCGRFYEKKRNAQDRIFKVCMKVLENRRLNDPQKVVIESTLRTKLQNRTHQYAELVCDFLGIQTVNDPAFAEMLMEKPDMVNIVCGKYFDGLRRQFQ